MTLRQRCGPVARDHLLIGRALLGMEIGSSYMLDPSGDYLPR